MLRNLIASSFLLFVLVIIVCVIYPIGLWVIGQTLFPFQANGSLLQDETRKPIGSKLIAQSFTNLAYFYPRPSAADYHADASASSALAPSNYLLRDRVARSLALIVKDQSGQSVVSQIENWFHQDRFQGKKGIVSQWATLHPSLATAWINAETVNTALIFFQQFSLQHPGLFLTKGKNRSNIQLILEGPEIASTFFDMWRNDHPESLLQTVPADLVMTSGSGLDPHISLQNAMYQLDRVSVEWAKQLKRNQNEIKQEIQTILTQLSFAPGGGLLGERMVNVLELNIILKKKYRTNDGFDTHQ